ncbi:MAG: HEPN domain-containing protein [Pseudonocardia sp.]|nr:HEPN domain-containing protein [Pseudonocardia sp.]
MRGIERARRELTAAGLLVEHGFSEPAVSRSYYAAFYAAESALSLLGESRAQHSGVLSAFVQLVVGRHGLDPTSGRLLRRLYTFRREADDSFDAVPDETARAAVADATRVVDAVARWVDGRSR